MAGRYPPALPQTTYRMPLLASLCYPAAVLRSPSPPLPWQQLSGDEVPVAADAPLDLSVRSGLGETAEGMRGGLASRRADHIEGSQWCDTGEAADRLQQSQHQQQSLLESRDDQPLDLTVSSAVCATRQFRPQERTTSSRQGSSPASYPVAFATAEGFATEASVPDDSRRLLPAAARVGRAVEALCNPLPRRTLVRDGATLSQSERDSRRSPASGGALGRLTCFAVSEASDRSSDGARPAGSSVQPETWPCGGLLWPTPASTVQRPFLRTADRLALPFGSSAASSDPSGRGVARYSSGKLDLELLGLRPGHTGNDGASAWPGAHLVLPVAQEATASAARQSTNYEPHWETKRNVKRLATVLPQQGVADRRRKQSRPTEVARLPVEHPASPASFRSIVDAAHLAPQPRACASLGSFRDGGRVPPPPAALGPDFRRLSDPNYFASPMAADRRIASAPPASGIPSAAAAAATAALVESLPADPPLNATSRGGKTEAQSYQLQAARSQPAKRKSSFDRLSEASQKSVCDLVNQPIKRSKEFAFDRSGELASLGSDGGGGGGGGGGSSGVANGKLSLARYMEAAAARVFLREKFNPPTDISALLLLQWPQGDRQDGPAVECRTVSPTAVADNLIGMLHQAVERGVRQQSVSPGPTLEGSPSEVTVPAAASSQPLSLAACVPAAEAVEAAASEPVSVASVPKEDKLPPAAEKSVPTTEKPIPMVEILVPISDPTSLAASTTGDASQPSAQSADRQLVTKDVSQQALPSCDTCSTAHEKQLALNLAPVSGAISSGRAAADEATPGLAFLKDHLATVRKSTESLEIDAQSASEHIGGLADRSLESQDICSATATRGLEKSSRANNKLNTATSPSAPSPPPQSTHDTGCGGGSEPGKPIVSNRSTVRQRSPAEGSAVQSKLRNSEVQGTTDRPPESGSRGLALLVGSCRSDHAFFTDEISLLDGCTAVGCRGRPPSSSSVGRQLLPASQGCCTERASPATEAEVKSVDLKDPLGEAVTVAVSTECTAKCDGDTDNQSGSGSASSDAGGSSEKWASMTNGEGRLVLVKVKYCCRHRLQQYCNGQASETVEVVDGGSAEQQVVNGAAGVPAPAGCC